MFDRNELLKYSNDSNNNCVRLIERESNRLNILDLRIWVFFLRMFARFQKPMIRQAKDLMVLSVVFLIVDQFEFFSMNFGV